MSVYNSIRYYCKSRMKFTKAGTTTISAFACLLGRSVNMTSSFQGFIYQYIVQNIQNVWKGENEPISKLGVVL